MISRARQHELGQHETWCVCGYVFAKKNMVNNMVNDVESQCHGALILFKPVLPALVYSCSVSTKICCSSFKSPIAEGQNETTASPILSIHWLPSSSFCLFYLLKVFMNCLFCPQGNIQQLETTQILKNTPINKTKPECGIENPSRARWNKIVF